MKQLTARERLERDRARLRRGIKRRDDWVREVVNPNIEAIWGTDKPDWWPAEDPWVDVRLIWASVRASLPSLLYSNPEFKTVPTRPIMDEAGNDVSFLRAKGGALWLNDKFARAGGTAEARIAVRNALFAMGVMKSGHQTIFADDEKRGVFELDAQGNIVHEDGRIWVPGDTTLPALEQGEYLTDEDGDVIFDEDGIPVLHPGNGPTDEEFWTGSTNPTLMIFDPEGKETMASHRWVAEEWERPISQVQNDPRYPKRLRERVKGSKLVDGAVTNRLPAASKGQATAIETDETMVTGYDLYDFEERRYKVVLLDAIDGDGQRDSYLIDEPIPAGIDLHPYSFLKMNDRFDGWYPEPDVTPMRAIQREYKVYRSMKEIHRLHAKSRYAEEQGAFWGENADHERAMMSHGKDGVLIKSRPGKIAPIEKAQRDITFQTDGPEIRENFNEVAVQGGEQRGVSDADTATQASLIATAQQLTSDDRRDNLVQAFLADVGRKLYLSGQANATMESYVRIDTPDAEYPFTFEVIRPEDLGGDFDIEISVGSTLAKNDPRSIQQLMGFLNAWAQNPAIGMIPSLVRRIADALNLDHAVVAEIIAVSEKQAAQAEGGGQGAEGGGPEQLMQVLQGALTGGTENAAGGDTTGAPLNEALA